MITTSVTLGTLVDRTMLDLAGHADVPQVVSLTAALAAADLTFQLTDAGNVRVSGIIEFESELVLVTAVSDDAVPVITVSRGYYGTTAADHATSVPGFINPLYSRHRVAEAIRRSLSRLEALGVPLEIGRAHV